MELSLQPSPRWKNITMRKTSLILAAAATLGVSAATPAYASPRTYPGPGGYPYWSGYVDAPVGEPIPPRWRGAHRGRSTATLPVLIGYGRDRPGEGRQISNCNNSNRFVSAADPVKTSLVTSLNRPAEMSQA